MKQEVTIKALDMAPGGTMVLTGEVQIGAENFRITNRWRVLKGPQKLDDGENILTYMFSDQIPLLTISYDDKEKVDANKALAVWVLSHHPLMQVLGGKNPQLKKAMFVLENARKKKLGGALDIQKRGTVYNR